MEAQDLTGKITGVHPGHPIHPVKKSPWDSLEVKGYGQVYICRQKSP